MQIVFSKEDHRYTAGDKVYTSVSKLLSKYKNEFNQEHWSTYKALEILIPDFKVFKKGWNIDSPDFIQYAIQHVDPDLLLIEKNKILESWGENNLKSINKGNLYHESREAMSYDQGFEINPFNGKKFEITEVQTGDKTNLLKDLYDLKDGFYPELLIWNEDNTVAGQADKVFIESIGDIRYIDIDDYKGLALDTPIATIGGWKNMEEIEVGDIIFDGNGNLTKIKHVSEIHHNPCYKITFDTNDELIADHEHKWVIEHRVGKLYQEKTYTTEELFNKFDNLKHNSLPRIKCTNIKTDEILLPIDPYILGLWYADGNRTCGTVTCLNQEIWEEVINRGYTISENHNENNNKAESRTIYGLRKELRKLKLLTNKHLPAIYLRASHNQRLDLLRGMMDGDGYLNRCRKRCVMATTKLWQAKDFSTLISSLGFKPTIIKTKVTGFNKENIPGWNVVFTPIENPFLIRNKDYFNIIKAPGKYSNHRIISKIEKIDIVPTKCIAVDSPDHTYLAGYNYIKTHNTNRQIKRSAYKNQKMKPPLSHLADCNYIHYNLQISFYAWMLEEFGFRVRDLSFHHFNQMYKLNYLRSEIKAIATK